MNEENHGAKVRQSTIAESVGGELVNGVFTGIVEVFPYDSNPARCKSNFTQGYDAAIRMNKIKEWKFSDATFQ